LDVEGDILRSGLVELGHGGLGEPDGLAIEADLEIKGTVAVKEDLAGRG
jgi:hypothetical protein